MKDFKRVVVLAPHTDDGEFGAGGFIDKLVKSGSEVYYYAFSAAEDSVPKGLPKDILRQEVVAATSILGVTQCHVFDYKVRVFPKHRQEILEDMVKIARSIKPDLVLMPSEDDFHQDHNCIAQEGMRAFKRSSIFAYEVPWNHRAFHNDIFVELSEDNLMQKVKALAAYKSQAFRNYANENFIRSLSTVRGAQVGFPRAEMFEAVRLIL